LLEDVDTELAELTDLVSELVALAQSPTADDESPTTVTLGDAAHAAAARLRRRTGRPVHVVADDSAAYVRPAQLDRAIGNLLSNADKFSPPGAPVDIEVFQGRVAVRDQGTGIAPHDRPHVFERFYRSEAARQAPGSGLGLAIVEQFVTAAGGTVFVEDAPGGGAVVGFTLPPLPLPLPSPAAPKASSEPPEPPEPAAW
jgi:two-component system sensor histidine kinase MprB